jgi:hypothetical protein
VFAGPLDLKLDPQRVRLSEAFDIATIPITPEQVTRIERDDKRVVRPSAWPPPDPKENDGVLLVGYPGAWRLVPSWNELDFRAVTLLLRVHAVHDRYLMCHRDPDYAEQVRVETQEDVPGLDLAGCSGGPVFLARNVPGELLVPELCGLVSQDRPVGDHILLQLARLHTLKPNGDIGAG